MAIKVKTVVKTPGRRPGDELPRIPMDQVTQVTCPVAETRRYTDEITGLVTEMTYCSTCITVSCPLEKGGRYQLDLAEDTPSEAVVLKRGETYYAADAHTLVSESYTRTKSRELTELG